MSDKDNEQNISGMLINNDNIDEIISKAIDDTDAEIQAEKEARRKAAEAEPIPETLKEAEAAKEEKIKKKPLFTLLATDIKKSDVEGTAVTGNLHGKITAGDVIYIMRPDLRIMRRTATMITVDGNKVDEAVNCVITLHIGDVADPLKVQKFSVISNIEPMISVDPRMPIENPQLFGMTFEAQDYMKDAAFMKALTLQIWSATYVLPCIKQKAQAEGEKNRIGLIPVPDPNNKDRKILPVFTDYRTLRLWKKIFEGNRRDTVAMSFRSLASSFVQQDIDGIVINLFGPKPVYLPKDLVQKFLSSDEFRWRFGGKDDRLAPKTPEQQNNGEPTEQKVVLGVPPITEETVIVQKQMAVYANKHEEIKNLYLLLKVDENNQKRYFVVVDGEIENEQKIFGGLFMSCGRFLIDMSGVEFITRAKAAGIEKLLEKVVPFYKA